MPKSKGKIVVGMGGWQLEPFNGAFYPPDAAKGFRKLEYYSRYFDLVEVNATFYTNTLTSRNAYQWMDDISGNENFKFSVKLFKAFTHSMDAAVDDVKKVHRLLEPMAAEEKLVGLIMQFPYGFMDNEANRAYLGKLSKAFSAFRLFVEVRHNSWNTPAAHDFFQQSNLHLINVDLPQIKKHMPLTDVAWGDAAYFRLMGRNTGSWDQPFSQGRKASETGRYLYRYLEDELRKIVDQVRQAASKVAEVFVVFHNDPEANSLRNGFQLRHLLEPEKQFAIPQNLIAAHPELKPLGISGPASAPSLFDDPAG